MSKVSTTRTLNEFRCGVDKTRCEWGFDGEPGRPWFRGHQRKRWKLIPSIFRLSPFSSEMEYTLRGEFAVRAPALNSAEVLPARDNSWDLYFLMQHYSAPTRLLDWTESPVIALYFALRDNPGYYDSAVWMLDPFELNKTVLDNAGEVIAPSAPGASKELADKIAPWLPERWSKSEIPDLPVAIFPTHIARRISNQKSCFTIHGKREDGLDHFAYQENSFLQKIIIPADSVERVLIELQDFGIDETTVFPDLEGLGRALSTAFRVAKGDPPHKDVFVRLGPSNVSPNRVGVFAIKEIPKGTRIFAHENEEMRWVDRESLPNERAIRSLYEEFGIRKGNRVGGPTSFNRLSPAWFMNQSSTPNTTCDENYDFYSKDDIPAGDELTVDSFSFSDESPQS